MFIFEVIYYTRINILFLGNQMEYLELVNNIAKKMLSSYSEEEKVGDGRDTQDHLQNIMAEIRELGKQTFLCLHYLTFLTLFRYYNRLA